MRFALLVVIALALGAALGLGADPRMRSQALVSLGIDPTKFQLRDLIPVWGAYDYVTREISKPRSPESLGFPAPTPLPTMIDLSKVGKPLEFKPVMGNSFGGGVPEPNRRHGSP